MKILPSSRLMYLCMCVYLCACICGQKKKIVFISSNLGTKYPLFLLELIFVSKNIVCAAVVPTIPTGDEGPYLTCTVHVYNKKHALSQNLTICTINGR